MYHLSNSLSERCRFDQDARAYAYECLRAAGSLTEIDPEALARHVIELEGLPDSDDLPEAAARFVFAFQQIHAELLAED